MSTVPAQDPYGNMGGSQDPRTYPISYIKVPDSRTPIPGTPIPKTPISRTPYITNPIPRTLIYKTPLFRALIFRSPIPRTHFGFPRNGTLHLEGLWTPCVHILLYSSFSNRVRLGFSVKKNTKNLDINNFNSLYFLRRNLIQGVI